MTPDLLLEVTAFRDSSHFANELILLNARPLVDTTVLSKNTIELLAILILLQSAAEYL